MVLYDCILSDEGMIQVLGMKNNIVIRCYDANSFRSSWVAILESVFPISISISEIISEDSYIVCAIEKDQFICAKITSYGHILFVSRHNYFWKYMECITSLILPSTRSFITMSDIDITIIQLPLNNGDSIAEIKQLTLNIDNNKLYIGALKDRYGVLNIYNISDAKNYIAIVYRNRISNMLLLQWCIIDYAALSILIVYETAIFSNYIACVPDCTNEVLIVAYANRTIGFGSQGILWTFSFGNVDDYGRSCQQALDIRIMTLCVIDPNLSMQHQQNSTKASNRNQNYNEVVNRVSIRLILCSDMGKYYLCELNYEDNHYHRSNNCNSNMNTYSKYDEKDILATNHNCVISYFCLIALYPIISDEMVDATSSNNNKLDNSIVTTSHMPSLSHNAINVLLPYSERIFHHFPISNSNIDSDVDIDGVLLTYHSRYGIQAVSYTTMTNDNLNNVSNNSRVNDCNSKGKCLCAATDQVTSLLNVFHVIPIPESPIRSLFSDDAHSISDDIPHKFISMCSNSDIQNDSYLSNTPMFTMYLSEIGLSLMPISKTEISIDWNVNNTNTSMALSRFEMFSVICNEPLDIVPIAHRSFSSEWSTILLMTSHAHNESSCFTISPNGYLSPVSGPAKRIDLIMEQSTLAFFRLPLSYVVQVTCTKIIVLDIKTLQLVNKKMVITLDDIGFKNNNYISCVSKSEGVCWVKFLSSTTAQYRKYENVSRNLFFVSSKNTLVGININYGNIQIVLSHIAPYEIKTMAMFDHNSTNTVLLALSFWDSCDMQLLCFNKNFITNSEISLTLIWEIRKGQSYDGSISDIHIIPLLCDTNTGKDDNRVSDTSKCSIVCACVTSVYIIDMFFDTKENSWVEVASRKYNVGFAIGSIVSHPASVEIYSGQMEELNNGRYCPFVVCGVDGRITIFCHNNKLNDANMWEMYYLSTKHNELKRNLCPLHPLPVSNHTVESTVFLPDNGSPKGSCVDRSIQLDKISKSINFAWIEYSLENLHTNGDNRLFCFGSLHPKYHASTRYKRDFYGSLISCSKVSENRVVVLRKYFTDSMEYNLSVIDASTLAVLWECKLEYSASCKPCYVISGPRMPKDIGDKSEKCSHCFTLVYCCSEDREINEYMFIVYSSKLLSYSYQIKSQFMLSSGGLSFCDSLSDNSALIFISKQDNQNSLLIAKWSSSTKEGKVSLSVKRHCTLSVGITGKHILSHQAKIIDVCIARAYHDIEDSVVFIAISSESGRIIMCSYDKVTNRIMELCHIDIGNKYSRIKYLSLRCSFIRKFYNEDKHKMDFPSYTCDICGIDREAKCLVYCKFNKTLNDEENGITSTIEELSKTECDLDSCQKSNSNTQRSHISINHISDANIVYCSIINGQDKDDITYYTINDRNEIHVIEYSPSSLHTL